MYSDELKRFIDARNGLLGGDDLSLATSLVENPQLDHIVYHVETNTYEEWDRYGNYYTFKAIPYEEAKVKRLVKKSR